MPSATTLPVPLDGLLPEDQEVLAEHLETVQFSPGDRILKRDDPGDGCYIIDRGEVRLEVEPVEVGEDVVLDYLQAGSVLGELSLLDRLPRSASAYAATAVTARRLSVAALDDLCEQNPSIGVALLRSLGRGAAMKLRRTTSRLSDHVSADTPDLELEQTIFRATSAQEEFEGWSEDRVDALLRGIVKRVAARAEALAEESVETTGMGRAEDKTLKNQVASIGAYEAMKGRPGTGALGDAEGMVSEVAAPAGVVFGTVPVTSPVSTAVFTTLIALKARNALILAFDATTAPLGDRVGALIREALEEVEAPRNLVQWVGERVSRTTIGTFMGHPRVSLVLAAGDPDLVRMAYSSGTPAIGVGPGNAPAWVCGDADLDAAAEAIVKSKSFDNGLITGAEHNLVVNVGVRDAFTRVLEKHGAAVLSEEEKARLTAVVMADGGGLEREIAGQSAASIAERAGIERPGPIRVLVVPVEEPSASDPYSGAKLAPILSLFTVRDAGEGMSVCRALLAISGAGHTAIIHTRDFELSERFGLRMPAGRILVNTPGAQGVLGLTTGLEPSFVFGCGTFAGTSSTDNVTYRNMINVKRLAYGTALRENPETARRVPV